MELRSGWTKIEMQICQVGERAVEGRVTYDVGAECSSGGGWRGSESAMPGRRRKMSVCRIWTLKKRRQAYEEKEGEIGIDRQRIVVPRLRVCR